MRGENICSVTKQEFLEYQKECGCITCDCDAFSQMSYHKGCHTFNLFDQEGDQTNSTESGGLYDESTGPKLKAGGKSDMTMEEWEYLHMENKKGTR